MGKKKKKLFSRVNLTSLDSDGRPWWRWRGWLGSGENIKNVIGFQKRLLILSCRIVDNILITHMYAHITWRTHVRVKKYAAEHRLVFGRYLNRHGATGRSDDIDLWNGNVIEYYYNNPWCAHLHCRRGVFENKYGDTKIPQPPASQLRAWHRLYPPPYISYFSIIIIL